MSEPNEQDYLDQAAALDDLQQDRDASRQGMSDLVKRLREDARGGFAYHELSDEAADRIEELEKALRELIDCAHYDQQLNENEECGGWWSIKTVNAITRARAALKDPAP